MAAHSRKRLDLTGQRFGQLTVLAPAENIGTRTAWLCRCDCGQEITVKTQYLRGGGKTSCGCKQKRGFTDGTSVGMLRKRTVRGNNTSGVPGVEWGTSINKWRATICFKGKRRYLGSFEKFEDAVEARKRAEAELFDPLLNVYDGKAPESDLRDIDEVCPPVVQDRSAQRMDLTGQRFGMLTALEPAENIGSMTAWRCRCDCGRECVVMTAHLRSGHTGSCGCKPSATYVDGTCVELIRARTVRSNNTSGVTGVEYISRSGLWKAVIFFKGKRHYLGSYQKFEDAVQARKRAEEELFDAFLEEFDRSVGAREDLGGPTS